MGNRILLVDDDLSLLHGLRRVLHIQKDWEVVIAEGCDQAMDAVGRTSFDAIILDVAMPGKDGFTTLAALKGTDATRDIPVVMLTGTRDSHLKRRALDMGATDLLSKPVDSDELIARLQSALRLKSYQDQLKTLNEELEHKVAERTVELEMSRLGVIWRLAKACEYRDAATGNHVVRVGCYSRILAQQLGMPQEFVKNLFFSSPLHDIGKIGIPDAILLKPGKLALQERIIMEQHCAIGAKILLQDPKGLMLFLSGTDADPYLQRTRDNNQLVEMAATIALTHHERWDGEGYPDGLAGDRIPIESRIVAIADVYDALCCLRPYKQAFAEEEVLATMRQQAGRHFDPDVFTAFERSIEEFRMIRTRFSDTSQEVVSEAVEYEKNYVC